MFSPQIIVTAVIQICGLAFFAGVYITTSKVHSKQLEKLEGTTEVHDREIGSIWSQHMPTQREVRR